jgi:hypothetical protein
VRLCALLCVGSVSILDLSVPGLTCGNSLSAASSLESPPTHVATYQHGLLANWVGTNGRATSYLLLFSGNQSIAITTFAEVLRLVFKLLWEMTQ